MTTGVYYNYTFTVNHKPTDGADAMFKLLITLASASWKINQSSDGGIFSTIGNVISGSGQLRHSGSWFVAQQPFPPYRSFCFQHQGSTTEHSRWRITYSPFFGFVAGLPDKTRVPSATDSFTLLGGGTDLAPTFLQMFPNDATYSFHMLAGNVVQGYNFFVMTNPTGSATANSLLMLDVFQPGTYIPSDQDPAVISQRTTASFAFSRATFSKPNNVYGQYGSFFLPFSGLELGHVTQVTSSGQQSLVLFPGGVQGSNIYTNRDDLFPIPWGRTPALYVTPHGYKGMSGMVYWPGLFRTTFTTLSIANNQDFIYVDEVILPWAGISPIA